MELSQKRTPRDEPVVEETIRNLTSQHNRWRQNKSHVTLIDSRTNLALPRARSEDKWRQALLNLLFDKRASPLPEQYDIQIIPALWVVNPLLDSASNCRDDVVERSSREVVERPTGQSTALLEAVF